MALSSDTAAVGSSCGVAFELVLLQILLCSQNGLHAVLTTDCSKAGCNVILVNSVIRLQTIGRVLKQTFVFGIVARRLTC